MNILITGGTGFLGARLAAVLQSGGHRVTLFDVQPTSRFLASDQHGLQIVRGDVANFADVASVIAEHRITLIYHASALLSGQAEERPSTAFSVNLVGTFHVLEAARILGVRMVVFTSTVATFGREVSAPVPNEAPQKPATMYGVTKVACERLGEYYGNRYDIDFRGVRLPSVVGAGRGGGGLSAYSNDMIEHAARGRTCRIRVAAHSRMPILYVKDAIRALIGLQQADKSSLQRSIYNIAGLSPTAGEIARTVSAYVPGAEIEFASDAQVQRVVDGWPAELDDREARSEWGWRLEYDLDRLVGDFVEEVRRSDEHSEQE